MDKFLIKTSSSTLASDAINETRNETTIVADMSEVSELSESDADRQEFGQKQEQAQLECGKVAVRKKHKYKQKFRDDWKTRFPWVNCDKQFYTTCSVCNIKIVGSISHLVRHEKSQGHIKTFRAARTTPSIRNIATKGEKASQSIHVQTKEAELKLTMFIVEHNLPFSLMEHLPNLCISAFPDSKIAKNLCLKRKKTTQLVTGVVGPECKSNIVSDLKSNYFSLIIDETTDITTTKCLVVIARYMKNQKVVDSFYDLLQVESCTAQSLFESITKSLQDNNIPTKNVVGFGADNCSVMMGNLRGVKALFKNINENIIVIGCSCHSLHLCASNACEKLPRSVEQLSRDIYNYIGGSSKRCAEFKECQIFIDEKPNAILKPSQTRWLSLQAVVNRILNHWNSLKLFFTRAALEDNLQAAQTILNALTNPVYKLYFYFLSYILEIINKINLEFQSDTTKIHVLLNRVTGLYKMILKSFIKKSYLDSTEVSNVNVNDPGVYLPLEEIYCGAKVQMCLNDEIEKNEIKNFKIRVLDFYVELCKQIKKRFNFNEKIYLYAEKFDPKTVMSGKINSVSEAGTLFPYIDVDIESLDFEYRLLSETNELKNVFETGDICAFWANVNKIKNGINEKMFPNICKVAEVVMVLPHSSAAAERAFSQLNLIKSKVRNRLLLNTCNSLLQVKNMLKLSNKNCYNWEPSNRMVNYNQTFIASVEILEEDIFGI